MSVRLSSPEVFMSPEQWARYGAWIVIFGGGAAAWAVLGFVALAIWRAL